MVSIGCKGTSEQFGDIFKKEELLKVGSRELSVAGYFLEQKGAHVGSFAPIMMILVGWEGRTATADGFLI